MDKLELLKESIVECKSCTNLLHKKTIGNGNINAKYMIIGDAPGYGKGTIDSEYGLAWKVGPSSSVLNKALKINGLIDNCWLTNILKCSTLNNKPSEKEEISYCQGYLLKEIEIINPEVIVALGNHVYEVLKNLKIDKPIVKVYHPAYIARFRKDINEYAQSFINKIQEGRK